MGRIEAICSSDRKGTRKKPVESGVLRENFGLEGDAHAGLWHRQVSLLALSDIESMREKGLPNLGYGDFGENLVVSGLDLAALGLGSRLRVGPDAELTITQRGKICHSHCEIYHQTGDCIMPRRGIFSRVLRGGQVAVGDSIEVIETVAADLYQAVVLTISDKGFSGERVDTAGPAVAEVLKRLPAHIYAAEVLPDEQEKIAERLLHYSGSHSIDLVVAVGGTGLAERDVTPEAVRAVVERLTPGIDEAMRAASSNVTPCAMLSRAVSGIRNLTLIISLPGSAKAAVENLQAVIPALPHGLAKLRGDETPCGPPVSLDTENTDG